MDMLAVEAITPIPVEQELIKELSEGLRPFYREDLPYHNFSHVHDDVLAEVLRLDSEHPETSTERGRIRLIGASLVHDAYDHLPLDPLEYTSKEERAAHVTRPVLIECGFEPADIRETDELTLSTRPGEICRTPNQVKLRRGDISNVGSGRLPFLGTSVNLFYEATLLADEYDHERTNWRTFIASQEAVLRSLLSQDLSLGSERQRSGIGPFNRRAMKNVNWLSKNRVRDPVRFYARYNHHLRPLVGEAAIESIIQVAS